MRRYLIRMTGSMMLAATLAACGEDSSGPTTTGISGTYATVVTLGQNTCSNVTVQNMPTIVTQATGVTSFSMQHGGQTYTGQLTTSNTFTTNPLQLSLNGNNYTITINGSFSGSRLEADVRLDVIQGNGTPCAYMVHWSGTRS